LYLQNTFLQVFCTTLVLYVVSHRGCVVTDVGLDQQQQRRVTSTVTGGASTAVSHTPADVSDSEASVDDSKQLCDPQAFSEHTQHLNDHFAGEYMFISCPIDVLPPVFTRATLC